MRALVRPAATTLLVAAPLAAVALTPTADAADDPARITMLTSDFEDGTVQGWAGRSAETVAHSSTVAHNGSWTGADPNPTAFTLNGGHLHSALIPNDPDGCAGGPAVRSTAEFAVPVDRTPAGTADPVP